MYPKGQRAFVNVKERRVVRNGFLSRHIHRAPTNEEEESRDLFLKERKVFSASDQYRL